MTPKRLKLIDDDEDPKVYVINSRSQRGNKNTQDKTQVEDKASIKRQKRLKKVWI